MGIIKNFFKREKELDETCLDDVLVRAILGADVVTRENVLSLPVVSGYVDLICNMFASIPFKLYKEEITDKGNRVVTEVNNDNRVSLINDDTFDTLDGFQFKKAMCEDYLLGFGGYAYINRSGNKILSVHYVENMFISPTDITAHPIFKNFKFNVAGVDYDDFEFIKLLRNTKNGAKGRGYVDEISVAFRSAVARLKYDYELAKTGGSRKGFLSSSNHLSTKAIAELRKLWDDYYSGNSSTVILNDGISFQEATNTSRESELDSKSRTFADEVKVIFHIGATYDETIKNGVAPIATAFATALNRDFLLEREKESLYFAPDMKELYKGSMRERYEAYKIAIESGFKTRNEIRYLEDDNYIEGLDTVNLGLGDVLLDTNSGDIYTPNTGQTYKFGKETGENKSESDDIPD